MATTWERYADNEPTSQTRVFGNPWSSGPELLQRQEEKHRISQHEVTDETLYEEKDEAIKQIHQEMRELQPLWIEVGNLVEQQSERVESIQTAVEASLEHVKKAKEEVAEANKAQIDSRKTTAIAAGAGAGIGAVLIGIITLKFLIH